MGYGAAAYARASQAAMTPRETEAALLFRAAQRLDAARAGQPGVGLAEAVRFNQKAWATLAEAATRPGNPLPAEVKANVASLAAFVLRRGLDALASEDARGLEAVAEISRQVATGLLATATSVRAA